MTASEVAELLHLPVSTVYLLARRGQIPARRLGRTWRFLRPNLEQLLRSGVADRRILRAVGDLTSPGQHSRPPDVQPSGSVAAGLYSEPLTCTHALYPCPAQVHECQSDNLQQPR